MIGLYLAILVVVTSTQRCCSRTLRQEGEVVFTRSRTLDNQFDCVDRRLVLALTLILVLCSRRISNVHCTIFLGDSNITESGADVWTKWCTAWYKRFDLSFTGFLINGDAGPLTNQVQCWVVEF